jgi:hypothetical protein
MARGEPNRKKLQDDTVPGAVKVAAHGSPARFDRMARFALPTPQCDNVHDELNAVG